MALREEGVSKLPDQRICQVLTNLGGTMSQVGRPAKATEYWDRALELVPLFSMARGNRGYGLFYYAMSIYDDGHKHLINYLVFLWRYLILPLFTRLPRVSVRGILGNPGSGIPISGTSGHKKRAGASKDPGPLIWSTFAPVVCFAYYRPSSTTTSPTVTCGGFGTKEPKLLCCTHSATLLLDSSAPDWSS